MASVTDSAAPDTAPTAQVPLTAAPFKITEQDGTAFSGTLQLSAPVHASDAGDAWASVGGHGELPCSTDATRDAVAVGTLDLAEDTPQFSSAVVLAFKGYYTNWFSEGAGYSSRSQCSDDSAGPGGYLDISPRFTSTSWGPVPVEFVLHGYYSPDHPTGDKSMLSKLLFEVGASSDGYGVGEDGTTLKSSSPLIASGGLTLPAK